MNSLLITLEFVVDTQSKLIKLIAPVNEYVSSHPDLLIYHSQIFMKNALSILKWYTVI